MNNVAFFFRNKLKENRFSSSVLTALNMPEIDSALLCSGFFQEDASYSVSGSKFSGISRSHHHLDLTTVGYYKGGKNSYAAFCAGLAHLYPSITHKALRLPGDKWHAKVFIGKAKGKPVIAAIGSSNLTRRAFDTLKNFNYECDVLFWDGRNKSVENQISKIIGQTSDETMSVVVAKVDIRHPVNKISIVDKLNQLEYEILTKAVQVL